jgi:hypothetical protein
MAIPLGFNSVTRCRRSPKLSSEETRHMNLTGFRGLHDSDGKGIIGCLLILFVIGIVIVLAMGLGPVYYSHSKFEAAVKAEVSRAGSQSLSDDVIIHSILALAESNKIGLTRKDILVERYAGQVHIEVNYAVPVSFVFFIRDIHFQIQASSFIGTP